MTGHGLRDWCELPRPGPRSSIRRPAVAEPVRRVVPLPRARRGPRRRGVLVPGRGARGDRVARRRGDHNWRRPHSSLGMKAPAVFAAEWATNDRFVGRRVTGRPSQPRARRWGCHGERAATIAATPPAPLGYATMVARLDEPPRLPPRGPCSDPTAPAGYPCSATRIHHQLSLVVDRQTGSGHAILAFPTDVNSRALNARERGSNCRTRGGCSAR